MSILLERFPEDRVRQFVKDLPSYHTLDLPNGWTIQGGFDHRPVLARYGFPESLAGKTALDAGTAAGFFAFEMERRGAERVLAIDTNRYDGSIAINPSPAHREREADKHKRWTTSFRERYGDMLEALGLAGPNPVEIIRDLTGSRVEFAHRSIYDLAAAGEQFDFVFCGNVVEHLKNPMEGLENLASATRERAVIVIGGVLLSPLSPAWMRRLRGLARRLGLEGLFVQYDCAMEYVGDRSSGAFFHFHPFTFRHALLASGFREVEIHDEFVAPLREKEDPSFRFAVFHCAK